MAKVFSEQISQMAEPIYIHCGIGWGAISFAMTHLGLGSPPDEYADWKGQEGRPGKEGWALQRMTDLGYHYERQQGGLLDEDPQSFYEGIPWPNENGDYRFWVLQAYDKKV